MKERPILFSAPMVRAILGGRKTQTRRGVKPQPPSECSIHYMLGAESWKEREKQTPLRHSWEAWWGPRFEARPEGHLCGHHDVRCPYGQPGDRLWVREAWSCPSDVPQRRDYVAYRATECVEEGALRWRPSIHMPRWASRLLLEVTAVRVERLQDISDADAIAEGCKVISEGQDRPCYVFEGTGYDKAGLCHSHPDTAFQIVWDDINGAGAWEANPWVWVVEFRRVDND